MQREFFKQIKLISANFTIFKFAFLTSLLATVYWLLATFVFVASFLFAQTTYNLEMIFRRTNWSPDTIRSYGNALSSAGDVNQDGFDDIVYSIFFDNWYGYGYVFWGGNPMDTLPDLILKCEGEGQPLMSICSGDLNGDSIIDVIIGEGQAGNWGKVFIYFGGAGMDSLSDITINGEPLSAWPFGISVASGDVNGDGFDDLVVGSYDNGDLNGRVYVYYGGPLLDTIPDVIINGHNGEELGISVGSGGDVNSDGFDDIVIGACENAESYPGAGKVYIFLGGNPMDTIPDCWLHGEGVNHYLGWFPVNLVLNVSTFSCALTGTPLYPYGFPSYAPGKLYVLFGGAPMDSLADWYKHGEDDSSSLGMASSSGGFESGDIWGEFIGGAPMGAMRYGKGSLWLGDSPIDSIEDASITGDTPIEVGWVVASAGDVDGDGYDEVMFSNYAADSNQTVWVCRYVGPGITETRRQGDREMGRFLQIFPNPFTKDLAIRYEINNNNKKITFKVFDVVGRIMKQGEEVTERQGVMKINIKDLPEGVYFIRVEASDWCAIRKVVKVK